MSTWRIITEFLLIISSMPKANSQTFQTMNLANEAGAMEVTEATLMHSVKARVYAVTGC